MRDAENPGRNRAAVIELIEFSIGFKQRVLHHIFAIQHRPAHTRAVAVEAWTELADSLKKRDVSRVKSTGWTDVIPHIYIYVCRSSRDT